MCRVAHRGNIAQSPYPENSLSGFRHATRLGVDAIEMDVFLSKDGELVVFHDPTLDRMIGRPGLVTDCTAQELSGMRFKNYPLEEGIPTIREVILGCRNENPSIQFVVEVKSGTGTRAYRTEVCKAVSSLFEELSLTECGMVISFDLAFLTQFHWSYPTIKVGLLYDTCHPLMRLVCYSIGAMPCPSSELITEGSEPMYVWTENNPITIRSLLNNGHMVCSDTHHPIYSISYT